MSHMDRRWYWQFVHRYGLWRGQASIGPLGISQPFRFAVLARSRDAASAAIDDIEAWNRARGWYPARHWNNQ